MRNFIIIFSSIFFVLLASGSLPTVARLRQPVLGLRPGALPLARARVRGRWLRPARPVGSGSPWAWADSLNSRPFFFARLASRFPGTVCLARLASFVHRFRQLAS